jgi:cell wall-associated NlpC family hydrolase
VLPHALRTVTSSDTTVSVDTDAPQSTQSAVRRTPLARLLALLTIVVTIASLGACTTSNSSTSGSAVVSYARQQIGKPYVYGATGPNSFDCSGLTQYVYAKAGKRIPRTTGEQQAAARYVSPSSGQPGDIVFIGGYHVGIYVGGGQMIDAPKSGDVVRQRAIWTGYSLGRF